MNKVQVATNHDTYFSW